MAGRRERRRGMRPRPLHDHLTGEVIDGAADDADQHRAMNALPPLIPEQDVGVDEWMALVVVTVLVGLGVRSPLLGHSGIAAPPWGPLIPRRPPQSHE
jgi:hypothetical protein